MMERQSERLGDYPEVSACATARRAIPSPQLVAGNTTG